MLKRWIVCGGLLLAAGGAYAESAAIAQRQTIYKSFNGSAKVLSDIVKGTTPYDGAVVKAALSTFADGSKKLPDLFPDDSKEGGKTQALPIIWTEKDKFNARMAKFNADASAALTAVTDEATLKSEAPKVLGNCKGCHDIYRAKS